MNYDWSGNLTELSSVIRRAVMLAKKDEIIPDQILLGLPKTEGKWELNILRIDWIRKFLASWIFPRVPQVVIGCMFVLTILFLYFGPSNPQSNLGLTLGWYIGWPLLFFSFFSWQERGVVFALLPFRGLFCRILLSQPGKLQFSSRIIPAGSWLCSVFWCSGLR
ncbi:MAG: hypothetical protein GY799_15365 [Desulfobulbaceae bacterium]|nr:hypothetical protein [Desulfobulbaceae bacterium]